MMDSLPDVHESEETRGEALDVSVSGLYRKLEIPEKFGGTQFVDAEITVSVNLASNKRGTHMSRISARVEGMALLTGESVVGLAKGISQDLDETVTTVYASFDYAMPMDSPITKSKGTSRVRVTMACLYNAYGDSTPNICHGLLVKVPIFTVCPCALACSGGKFSHTQRCMVTVKLIHNGGVLPSNFDWIEDVSANVESVGVPLYSVLKRPDEVEVIRRGFENPMFVEDVARDVFSVMVQRFPQRSIHVIAESEESIHQHNAMAEAFSVGVYKPLFSGFGGF